jgi:hypothetical protein
VRPVVAGSTVGVAFRDLLGDVLGVASDPTDQRRGQRRGQRILEDRSHEVQARLGSHDAAVVHRAACLGEATRSIQSKSGSDPVHQITLATSRSRRSSSTGRPPRVPVVLGTRSIPAAVRPFGRMRASGRHREWRPPSIWNFCRTARPIGVLTVSTWVAMNQTTGMRSRSHLLLPVR